MIYVLPFVICVLWLVGGQVEKGFRRFGIPGSVSLAVLWGVFIKERAKRPKLAWSALAWLLCIPVLSMGYGVDSWLGKVFKKDLTIRVAYAIILSLPFFVFERVTGEPGWFIIPTVVSLIGAFQVRAGSLFQIGEFDVLVEDVVRSLTFGTAVSVHLYVAGIL